MPGRCSRALPAERRRRNGKTGRRPLGGGAEAQRPGLELPAAGGKFGVSSTAIGRRAVQECWHGTDAQRANARLRNLAAGLRRQAEQRLAGELDTREIKELTAVLRELMNLQQTLEGQQPGGSPLRVVLEEETEDWSV